MKLTFKKISGLIIVTLTLLFSLTGCYETRYVHDYNHHTRGWYDRRHVPPPGGVNFELDVRHR